MKALVLAGGEGLRLRPLTYSIPKPLIPVGDTPILEKIVRRLGESGFDDIILAVGYRGELIETYFRDGSPLGVNISYVREPSRLGTAGALSLVRREFALKEPLLAMNGDILTRLDLRVFREWHCKTQHAMSVAVRPYESQLPFGKVLVDGGRLTEMVEKPRQQQLINAGMYMLNPEALTLVPDDTFFDMPDLVAAVLARGCSVGAFHFDCEWLAVDGLAQLEEANREILKWAD